MVWVVFPALAEAELFSGFVVLQDEISTKRERIERVFFILDYFAAFVLFKCSFYKQIERAFLLTNLILKEKN
jgi:hypothetical protein